MVYISLKQLHVHVLPIHQTDLGRVLLDSEPSGFIQPLSLCGVEAGDTCVSDFTDELIAPPPSGDCQSLQADLPPQCQGSVSVDILFLFRYITV